ncbi:SAM-dependent methyltransferase [Brevibacillus choshinensis]|uniref:Class I SAM-dependent methyltransferase n=1 Tax=Brevibacillus choshinensis TaxID=54911 RepID=A0ABX7FM10_BRECH|nr:class I SAM-dependent methyltransferase [Brevibacillus choshinensis]QRG66687.1 class I SAM-dependent methyltransferase [Brevibacillus choshinensis]
MDRNKFSAIAHRDHVFYNPISEAKMNQVLEHIPLQPNDPVVDIGAGTCELLIRLAESRGISGTAIELYEEAIEAARRRAGGRITEGQIEFLAADAQVALGACEQQPFSLGICVGSTHALGGFVPTLKALQKCVKKDGYILIGEGYWKQKPSEDYLQALGGAEESELQSHYDNVRIAEELGLVTLWSSVASEEDWDQYEWLYSMSVENYCQENPQDPDCEAYLQRIRAWRHTYLKWGRDTLGFGLYLFRR